jgi:hypothetical protein
MATSNTFYDVIDGRQFLNNNLALAAPAVNGGSETLIRNRGIERVFARVAKRFKFYLRDINLFAEENGVFG